jgi:hypothetical protein
MNRPPTVPSSLGRGGEFCLYSGGAAGPDTVGALRSSLDQLHRAMTPWATGAACLNFLAGPDVTSAQVRSAFRPTDLLRLESIARRVDPDTTFGLVPALGPAGTEPQDPVAAFHDSRHARRARLRR